MKNDLRLTAECAKNKGKVIEMKNLNKTNIGELRKAYGEINDTINTNEYREFKSKDEAELWGKENFDEWASNHKKMFQLTLKYGNPLLHLEDPADMYFGDKHSDINKALRKETAYDSVPRDIVSYTGNLMMTVLSAPVIGERVVLYKQVPKKMVKKLVEYNKKGVPYLEKGFLSTSMVKECCANHCGSSEYMLKIYVDDYAPIHAIFANAIRVSSEEELLLPPKMYMRMVKYPYVDEVTGKIVYEVRLINMVW